MTLLFIWSLFTKPTFLFGNIFPAQNSNVSTSESPQMLQLIISYQALDTACWAPPRARARRAGKWRPTRTRWPTAEPAPRRTTPPCRTSRTTRARCHAISGLLPDNPMLRLFTDIGCCDGRYLQITRNNGRLFFLVSVLVSVGVGINQILSAFMYSALVAGRPKSVNAVAKFHRNMKREKSILLVKRTYLPSYI